MNRKEEQKYIPIKHVAVGAPQLPQSLVWDVFDRVIQGSQTPTDDTPVSDSVETNRSSVMQMIRAYIAELTIDRMSDPLKWWTENGVKKIPIARQYLCSPPTSVLSQHLFSSAGLI